MKKNIGILLLFVSMAIFYWGYHASQQTKQPVAGWIQKDNGTRQILYIDLLGVVILMVGGYLAMEEKE